MEITMEQKWTTVEGVGLNVRSCYWSKHGEDPIGTFCADTSPVAADGTLTQHMTSQIPHKADYFLSAISFIVIGYNFLLS